MSDAVNDMETAYLSKMWLKATGLYWWSENMFSNYFQGQ